MYLFEYVLYMLFYFIQLFYAQLCLVLKGDISFYWQEMDF